MSVFKPEEINTEPMVVLTTAHLPESEGHKTVIRHIESGEIAGMHRDEGYLVYTGTHGMPEDVPVLASICEKASEQGIHWLLFDRDACEVFGLDTYEW